MVAGGEVMAKRLWVALPTLCVLFGVADGSWAKGYGGQTLTKKAEGTDPFLEAYRLLLITPLGCPGASPAQCLDSTYGMTTCGQKQAQVLIDWDAGTCAATCDAYVPTLQECQTADFLNSICGQRERDRMFDADAYSLIADDQEQIPIPDHPSTCVDILRVFGEDAQNTSPFQSVFDNAIETVAVVADTSAVVVGDDNNPTVGDETLLSHGYSDPNFPTHAVRQTPPAFARFETDGTSSLFGVKVAQEDIGLRNQDSAAYETNIFLAIRNGWDANGIAVESCREYAYEKFYDYSKWEDRTHYLGADARAKVLAAYDDEVLPWSIGTRMINGIKLRRKDGVQTYEQVFFGSGFTAKNEFFATPTHFPSDPDRQENITEWNMNGYNLSFPDPTTGEVYTANTIRPLDILNPIILDEDLWNTLVDGRLHHKVTKTWAWHKQMSEDLFAAGYIDEELFARDRLKERYAQLLHQRHLLKWYLADQILEAYGFSLNQFLEVPDLVPGFHPEQLVNPADDLLNLGTFSQALTQIDVQNEEVQESIGLTTEAIHPGAIGAINLGFVQNNLPGGTTQTAYSGTSNVGPTKNYGLSSGLIHQLTKTHHSSFSDIFEIKPGENKFERLARLAEALAVADFRLESYLNYAADYGCLDLEGPNPCDWSPDYFANTLRDFVASARERDYQTCLKKTAPPGAANLDPNTVDAVGFAQLFTPTDFVEDRFYIDVGQTQKFAGYYDAQGNPQKLCNLSAYNGNTEDVEWFFRCIDLYRGQLIYALDNALDGGGVALDPATNEVKLSDNTSDGEWLGGDAFGVGYDYAARWSLTGLKEGAGYDPNNPDAPAGDQDWCALKPHLHGHMDVEARAMYADVDLFSASADVGLDPAEGPPNGYIEILGQTLIGTKGNLQTPQADTFHVIFKDKKELSETFFSVRATVMIGPVPVTIKAGLAGRIGANFELSVGSGPGSGGSTCQAGGMVLSARFAPFASVDAFASASLDALIVEAGVKISLVIAGITFPFTTTLRAEGKVISPTNTDVRLVIDSNLDVVFWFLSGRVSAFVKFCFIICETIEGTIFEWDGPRIVIPLVDTSFSIRLVPLAGINPPAPASSAAP